MFIPYLTKLFKNFKKKKIQSFVMSLKLGASISEFSTGLKTPFL